MWLELGGSLCLIAENVTLPRHLTNGGGWLLSRTSLAVILLEGLSVPATNSSPAIPCVLLLACPSASRISSMTILLHSPRKSRSRTWARVLSEKLPSCARGMCKKPPKNTGDRRDDNSWERPLAGCKRPSRLNLLSCRGIRGVIKQHRSSRRSRGGPDPQRTRA